MLTASGWNVTDSDEAKNMSEAKPMSVVRDVMMIGRNFVAASLNISISYLADLSIDIMTILSNIVCLYVFGAYKRQLL